jgi:hypothetical protein
MAGYRQLFFGASLRCVKNDTAANAWFCGFAALIQDAEIWLETILGLRCVTPETSRRPMPGFAASLRSHKIQGHGLRQF